MNQINKVSDITPQDVAEYIRIPEPTTADINFLTTCIGVAKDYISKYTGVALGDLNNYEDFVIVVFVLCQDMYDTRTAYVDSDKENITVTTILNLHQRNLL